MRNDPILFLILVAILALGFALFYVVSEILTLLRDKRPRATRIVLQFKEILMSQTETLKVGKTYLITPQPVGDAGEPEPATNFAYALDDTSFATLIPAQDGTATLSVQKAGTAKLVVTAQNADNQQISGEADLTAPAAVATSINLQFTEQ